MEITVSRLSRYFPDGLSLVHGPRPSSALVRLKYLWMGFLMGLFYWVLESYLHVVFFHQVDFMSELLPSDHHELWKRVFVFGLLSLFGAYVQHGVNARRRTEEALATSERKYRTLITEALNPVFVFDERGRFLDYNNAALEFFQCDAQEFLATTYQQLAAIKTSRVLRDDAPFVPELGRLEVEFKVQGATKAMLLNVVPVKINGGPDYYYGIGQDITDRKQMESNLKLAHAELDQIFRTASSAMRVIDADSTVLKVNQTFARLSGVSEQVAVGRKCYDVFAGEKCFTDECPLTRIFEGETEIKYELTKTRNDGTPLSCLLTARPFMGSDGTPVGIVESFNDITELTRVQEELRTERDRLRHILFQQVEGVAIINNDFTIEYQNSALKKEIGAREGKTCFEVFCGRHAPCTACSMRKAIESGEPEWCEFTNDGGRIKEHTYTPFADSAGDGRVLVLVRDVTQRKASREAAIRSEQLAALGELAAGVAHEINNPVNGIINYAQMLVNSHRSGGSVKEIASRIVKEGDRVAYIVERLLAFVRRNAHQREPVSVVEILTDALALISAQLRRDSIDVRLELPPELPRVFCVPQEIQQVFLNVIDNARYALNEKYQSSHEGKVLEISARVDASAAARQVVVSIHDNGIGIPSSISERVMNPFFSTKSKGNGTGLGLSISHAIISEYGGRITIDSTEGEYTRVDVQLPELAAFDEAM